MRVAKVILVVGLIAALAYSVHSQWGTVRHDVARLPILDGVAALLLALIATGASMLAWRSMLGDLGSRLPLLPALHIYALSALGKYVPGSVWPVLAQMELGRAYAIPRLRSATAFLLTLMGSVVSATATGGLLAVTSPGWGRLFALLPLVLIVMHPRVLVPLTTAIAKVLRRPAVTEEPSVAGVTRSMGWLLVQWVCIGGGTAIMADGLGSSVSVTRCIAAVALSWAAGLVVVVVPAGAGVREGVLTYLLASSLGSGRALALALLGRLALTLADAFGAALGALVARRAKRQHNDLDFPPPLPADVPSPGT
jgi:hypothetical protein